MLVGFLLISAAVLTIFTAGAYLYSFSKYDDQEGQAPLEGNIRESRNRKVVEDVRITIEGTEIVGYSDSQGDYRLDNVPVGEQTVVFEKPGYRSILVTTMIFGVEILEQNERSVNTLNIPTGNLEDSVVGAPTSQFMRWAGLQINETLIDPGNVTGTVMDNSGQGIGGAIIILQGVTGNLTFNGESLPSGNYKMLLPAGRYWMNATDINGNVSRAKVFIPPGDDLHRDITLSETTGELNDTLLSPGGNLAGTVSDSKGNGIDGAVVHVFNQQGEEWEMGTDGNGGFAFTALPCGIYDMEVESYGFRVFYFVNITVLQGETVTQDVGMEGLEDAEEVTYSLKWSTGCFVFIGIIGIMDILGGIMAFRRKNHAMVVITSLIGLAPAVILLNIPLIVSSFLCMSALLMALMNRRGFEVCPIPPA